MTQTKWPPGNPARFRPWSGRSAGRGRAGRHWGQCRSGLCRPGLHRREAGQHGIELEVVKLPEAKRGFVLLPRRWVVERSFAWATRFRRLVKDYERYPSTLADLHIVAFVCLMLKQAA